MFCGFRLIYQSLFQMNLKLFREKAFEVIQTAALTFLYMRQFII
jgi:hypothetical protein